jgi:poly(3-hydroxybutyrate) depolymerase
MGVLILGAVISACAEESEPALSEAAKVVAAFSCPEGGTIVAGSNTLMVNGRARTLIADFPADPNAPMGILVSWHGYNQPEGDHHRLSNLNPDGNAELPVVVITPDDVEFELPAGLDWQLDEGSPEFNVDLQFFEAMVGCLSAQYDIDPNRVYSLGYSAGSVMSSLLHSVYPKLVGVVVAISGMWFNDPQQVNLVTFGSSLLTPTWPALDPADRGTILLTHGGATDIAAGVINLEATAQAAFPFLKDANRVVIDCPHNEGHTGHPDVVPSVISKFISENRVDELSPYLAGGYAGFPDSCTLRLP